MRKKDKIISFRCNDVEYEMIKECADKENVPISRYCIYATLNHKYKRVFSPDMLQVLGELLEAANHSGSHEVEEKVKKLCQLLK